MGESNDGERNRVRRRAPCIMLLSTPALHYMCPFPPKEPGEKNCSFFGDISPQLLSYLMCFYECETLAMP